MVQVTYLHQQEKSRLLKLEETGRDLSLQQIVTLDLWKTRVGLL